MRYREDTAKRSFGLLLTGIVALATSSGCKPEAVGFGGNVFGGVQVSDPVETTNAIRHIRPGLAVRGMACLACHANIQASIITDFGYGDTYYLDDDLRNGDGTFRNPINNYGQSHYNPYTWQSLHQVAGQLVIPAVTVPAEIVSDMIVGSSAPMGLSDFLTSPNAINQSGSWNQNWAATIPFDQAVTPGVDANGNANSPTVAVSSIYIGAPTKAQVIALAPNPTQSAPWVQSAVAGDPAPTGFVTVSGVNGGLYVTNSGPVQCAGKDIVINGTLLLENLSLYAGNGGCRLYVTGSVFVYGPITYLDANGIPDSTQNLQITSATSIIMGVGLSYANYGYGTSPMHNRLIDDVRNAKLRMAPDSASYTAWGNGVMAEANNIGASLLKDAGDVSGAAQTASDGNGNPCTAINFSHLLLNAPEIHSRYVGSFSGVIVAEIAIFALGEFSFSFDDVFLDTTVPILPTLPVDILCVENPSACVTPSPTPVPSPTPTPTPSPAPSPTPNPGNGGIIGI